MEYTSTRDASVRAGAAHAIVTGLAPGGGLFVPAETGRLDWAALQGASYEAIALAVLRIFLPDYDPAFLQGAIAQSYGAPFGGKAGRMVKLRAGLHALELWHGPTAAFKDYALQLMPKLLVEAKRMEAVQDETLILVATSGDTGSAALQGYRDIPGVRMAVFYPTGGTSEIQRLQMATCEGQNIAVFGVEGNFDDAQRGVKAAFGSEALHKALAAKHCALSSANSINWGRLVPQIVYYVSSYLALCAGGAVAPGDPVDFCVPTGNFGDIMAGWYAKQLGLPVGKLVCASNKNNVLTDFFATGRYDARREFYKTSSPSMDILVSSNLERLLYHASGSDAAVRGYMQSLAATGAYTVEADVMARIRDDFAGGYADEEAVTDELRRLYETDGYLCDPHTAVAFHVLRRLQEEETAFGGGNRPAVVLSTASPFKFCEKVLAALGQPVPADSFAALDALERYSRLKSPVSLRDLKGKPVRFTETIAPEEIAEIPLRL